MKPRPGCRSGMVKPGENIHTEVHARSLVCVFGGTTLMTMQCNAMRCERIEKKLVYWKQRKEGREDKNLKAKVGDFCFQGGDAGAKGAGMRKEKAEDDEMRTSPFADSKTLFFGAAGAALRGKIRL